MAPMTPPPQSNDDHGSGSGGKRKKKANTTIIENIPDIPDHEESHSVPYYYSSPPGQKGRSSGARIKEGTLNCPIHVSDTEDNSDVAVRGDRKHRIIIEKRRIYLPKDLDKGKADKLSSAKSKGKSSSPSTPNSRTSDGTPRSNEDDKTKTKQSKQKNKEADDLVADAAVYLSTIDSPRSQKSKASTAKTESSNEGDICATTSTAAKCPPVHVDVTALSDDLDPVLERELEEIALTGRSGMISGTPTKALFDDVEYGKRGKRPSMLPIKPARHNSVTFVEDEADKSGHGLLLLPSDKMYQKKKRRRFHLSLGIAGLILLLIIILITVIVKNKNSKPQPGDPLTAQQQQIHTVLETVTGTKTLLDPATSQHKARQWLLYEDEVINSVDEEGIIQRYALVVLYFATGGQHFWEDNNWLQGPECGDAEGNGVWTGINCSPEGNVRALALGMSIDLI